uniref:Akirin-1 n=1 Tax=Phallusia mammillata TaxID=59560 RepID=A0A6F9D6N8_9ASCI|nr:akirin-1 [Phallusia mammillata]
MACVTLKRRLDFQPLHEAGSSPVVTDSNCAPSCKKRFLTSPYANKSESPPSKQPWKNPLSMWQKFETDLKPLSENVPSPFCAKKNATGLSTSEVVNGIYKKYRQMKRRQTVLEAAQKEGTKVSLPGTSTLNTHMSVPEEYSGNVTSEQPLLTLKQVTLICQQLLKDQEDSLRAEYESTLLNKLSEQYEAFVKFNQDQLKKMYESHAMSYVS